MSLPTTSGCHALPIAPQVSGSLWLQLPGEWRGQAQVPCSAPCAPCTDSAELPLSSSLMEKEDRAVVWQREEWWARVLESIGRHSTGYGGQQMAWHFKQIRSWTCLYHLALSAQLLLPKWRRKWVGKGVVVTYSVSWEVLWITAVLLHTLSSVFLPAFFLQWKWEEKETTEGKLLTCHKERERRIYAWRMAVTTGCLHCWCEANAIYYFTMKYSWLEQNIFLPQPMKSLICICYWTFFQSSTKQLK